MASFRARLSGSRREALEQAVQLLEGWMLFHEPPEYDDDALSKAARDELILRRGVYTLCNKMTIYLTIAVLVSLPILFVL